MALVYQLEKEHVGADHLKTQADSKVRNAARDARSAGELFQLPVSSVWLSGLVMGAHILPEQSVADFACTRKAIVWWHLQGGRGGRTCVQCCPWY